MNKQNIKYGIKKIYAGYFLALFDNDSLISLEISKSKYDLLSFLENNYSDYEKLQSDETLNSIHNKIQNPEKDIEISINPDGSNFQKKVWQHISSILPGETKSYSQIAKEIGEPKSFRAVANACAANKIAILIPCHRVIKKNGELSGYKWGHDLKKEILNKEKTLYNRRKKSI